MKFEHGKMFKLKGTVTATPTNPYGETVVLYPDDTVKFWTHSPYEDVLVFEYDSELYKVDGQHADKFTEVGKDDVCPKCGGTMKSVELIQSVAKYCPKCEGEP